MALHDEALLAEVPISGRMLALPPGPIFHLHRAADSDYQLGEFRAWAGYKTLGVDAATDGLAHFQHVVSFGATQDAGRTGVHGHFAHVHAVIPTSGRGVFSYDGVTTEAVPGVVIHQHGGTIHDQFDYSYAGGSDAETRRTPQSLEPLPPGARLQSFGFLELFVPLRFANVEIVPPTQVTEGDQRSAWDHPYHAKGAAFSLQAADDPAAAYHPVAGRPDLEARDGGVWAPSGELCAVWIVRAARGATGSPAPLAIPGERGGLVILYMVKGSANVVRDDGELVRLNAGDCLTASQDLAGDPVDPSPDMSLLKIFISGRAEALRERTPAEIEKLEALGPAIITRREVRSAGDTRPVNTLHGS
ncbi:hypothetical protein ACO2Q3_15285 [Caulobacter sp. KR2-114]|uniref:hypothetical protein n=1 Tax=Caulobacter sp. KR2-114 TaxID=3400912 RepID=UPI003BFE90DF